MECSYSRKMSKLCICEIETMHAFGLKKLQQQQSYTAIHSCAMHNTCCALKHGWIPKRYVLVILLQHSCTPKDLRFLLSKGFSFLFEVFLFFSFPFFFTTTYKLSLICTYNTRLVFFLHNRCFCITLVQLDLILQAETRQSKCKYIRSYSSSASASAATIRTHVEVTANEEKKYYYSPTFMFCTSFALLCFALLYITL